MFKRENPWNYPALDFEELKTLTLAFMTYRTLSNAGELGNKLDLVDSLNIPSHVQEANQKRAKSMMSYFRSQEMDN